MECPAVNLPFQVVINHPIMSNNCKNVVPLVFLLNNDIPGVALKEEQPYITQLNRLIIKNILISE